MASKWISHIPLMVGLLATDSAFAGAQQPNSKAAEQSVEQTIESARIVSKRTSIAKLYDNSPVLLIGETHNSRTAVNELTANLGKLKAKGVKHLALEMPEDFQPFFDDYKNKKVSREQFVSELKKAMNPRYEQEQPGVTEAFVQLVDEAHKKKMEVHCVDLSTQGQVSLEERRLQQTDLRARIRAYSRAISARNEAIATNFEKLTKDGSKVVMLVGMEHTGQEAEDSSVTIQNKLDKRGVRSQSIDFHGGKDADPELGDEIELRARREHIAHKHFLVKGDPSADINLHRPQTKYMEANRGK